MRRYPWLNFLRFTVLTILTALLIGCMSISHRTYCDQIHLDNNSPRIKKNYKTPKVFYLHTAILYPTDCSIPVVHCKTNYIRDIQLGNCEQILSLNLGDSANWQINSVTAGTNDEVTAHVLIKPLAENLKTNLIITTDKRTYQLELKSTRTQDLRRVQFYLTRSDQETSTHITNSKYLIKSSHWFKKPTWMPVSVYDNGQKTFIKMPSFINSLDMPSFAVLDEEDHYTVVNYRIQQHSYIVDQLFDRAVLLRDVGHHQEKIWIIRNT